MDQMYFLTFERDTGKYSNQQASRDPGIQGAEWRALPSSRDSIKMSERTSKEPKQPTSAPSIRTEEAKTPVDEAAYPIQGSLPVGL